MGRLRIMQLVLSLSPGGTERLVIEICRRLEPSVDSTVCCLDKVGDWAPQLTGAGVPVFALERLRARASLGIPGDAYVVGAAGRLDPVKNLPALVDAHAAVAQHKPGARLVIIGSGPMQAELEAQARARGIADAVRFTGYRADV